MSESEYCDRCGGWVGEDPALVKMRNAVPGSVGYYSAMSSWSGEPCSCPETVVGYFATGETNGRWKIVAEMANGGLHRVGGYVHSRTAARSEVERLNALLPAPPTTTEREGE